MIENKRINDPGGVRRRIIDAAYDAFPLNSSESVDSDNDGIGNNGDTDDDGDGGADINEFYPIDVRYAY